MKSYLDKWVKTSENEEESEIINIRKYNLDPIEFLSDVLRRTKKTAKEQLVDLLVDRW